MSISSVASTNAQTPVAPTRKVEAEEPQRMGPGPRKDGDADDRAAARGPSAQTTNLQGQVIGSRLSEKA